MTLAETRPAARATAAAPRVDMYRLIHKALRRQMFDALQRIGSADVTDEADLGRAIDAAEAMLAQLRSHLQHENDVVHAALEARQPGAAAVTAGDHLEHQASISALLDDLFNLRGTPVALRPQRIERLYRHLSLFVAENLQHMHIEETSNNAALWSLYSDEELHEIHGRIIAAVPPAEMMSIARWMAASGNAQELAGLFGEMKGQAPEAVFSALLDIARSALDEARWAKLARALGVTAAPGLMTA